MKTVFVDTSGFYAFLDPDDPFHPQARDCFLRGQREAWRMLTTNYVVHESWAVIQARLGWSAVDAWADHLLSQCRVHWVTEELHGAGVARCRQARERQLSLTDCVSIEFVRRMHVHEAIACDDHFRRAGLRLP